MKLRRTGILLSLLFISGLCSVANAQEKQAGRGKHLLWRVSSGQNTIYMLGSIHLLKKENYPLPGVIDKAFRDSEVAVFEVDLAEMAKPETAQRMLLLALMPAGKSLRDELKEKTYERLGKRTGEMGLPIEGLSRFKSWYVGIAVATAKLQQLGFQHQYGVDRHYHGKALRAKKPVLGLETSEYMLGVLSGLAQEKPDEFLNQMLDDLDVIDGELKQIVKAWSTGNAKEMEATVLKSFKDHPEVYEALITQRNKNWLVKIEEFLKGDKKHFVVVGSAHVVGKDGLVKMLEKKGYTVEQL